MITRQDGNSKCNNFTLWTQTLSTYLFIVHTYFIILRSSNEKGLNWRWGKNWRARPILLGPLPLFWFVPTVFWLLSDDKPCSDGEVSLKSASQVTTFPVYIVCTTYCGLDSPRWGGSLRVFLERCHCWVHDIYLVSSAPTDQVSLDSYHRVVVMVVTLMAWLLYTHHYTWRTWREIWSRREGSILIETCQQT